MTDKTIRWGILGCGDVCEVKSGPGFQKAEGSELVAVMRRDGAKAEDFAKRHGVPRWYDDAEALINDAEVDAVYIASPPGTHLELAKKVAAAGKPCYVEKPMARHAKECRAMIQAFQSAGAPLFVAYYRRRVPKFVRVKEMLDDGVIGDLQRVSYEYREAPAETNAGQQKLSDADADLPWRLQAEHSGGGLFMDMGCHALDLLDCFLGALQGVKGKATRAASHYRVEDRVELTAKSEACPVVSAAFDFAFDGETVDRFFLEGEEGSIEVPCFLPGPIIRRDETGKAVDTIDIPNPPHIQQPMIQAVVDQLRGGASAPSTGVTALRTNEVMDAALASYYGGRDDAFWERPDRWS